MLLGRTTVDLMAPCSRSSKLKDMKSSCWNHRHLLPGVLLAIWAALAVVTSLRNITIGADVDWGRPVFVVSLHCSTKFSPCSFWWVQVCLFFSLFSNFALPPFWLRTHHGVGDLKCLFLIFADAFISFLIFKPKRVACRRRSVLLLHLLVELGGLDVLSHCKAHDTVLAASHNFSYLAEHP